MPEWQTEARLISLLLSSKILTACRNVQRVLVENLGEDWRSHFESFDLRPFAAASIGQVHSAVISASSPLAVKYPQSLRVAVKVQFPGVRSSISGDLQTLRWLLLASAALPRGLYLDNTLRVLERELDDECDYVREAECGQRMREHIASSPLNEFFDVPRVVTELSGPMVLTTEMMDGRPLKEVLDTDQASRDRVRPPLFSLLTSHTETNTGDVGADWIAHPPAVSPRDPQVSPHANGSELEQFSLQRLNAQGSSSFPPFSHTFG